MPSPRARRRTPAVTWAAPPNIYIGGGGPLRSFPIDRRGHPADDRQHDNQPASGKKERKVRSGRVSALNAMFHLTLLPGLPAYGPMPTAFPVEWGRLGREGKVVEFKTDVGTWVGNFKPGLGGINLAGMHPNGRDAVIIAAGDLWVVNPDTRVGQLLLPAIDAAMEVQEPTGWIFSWQGLALVRLGSLGIVWHTRRLSWDGFDQLRVDQGEVKGLAWSPDDQWHPFCVDLGTGRSTGGSFGSEDSEGWEKCL